MKTTLLISVLSGLLLAGCGGGEVTQDVEITAEEDRTMVPGERALALDGYNGAFTVGGRKDSTATLRFEKHARGMDEEEARSYLEAISIEAEEGSDTYRIHLRSHHTEKTQVDVRAQVPYRTPLRLDLENGTVAVEAMAGPIQVAVGNGPVRIKGAANDLDVRSNNGDLNVSMAGFREETRVRLETSNGSIELVLPASAAASVEAQTEVGTVDVQGLSLADRKEEKSATGNHVQGVLGDSTGQITVRTKNGSIVLRSGQ